MHCSETTHLDSTSGYISSFTTRQKCGNRKTSWTIQSSPGQQVNISLIDFGYGKEDDKKRCFGQVKSSNIQTVPICYHCYHIVISLSFDTLSPISDISEEGHKSNTTICRQHGQKEQHVYTSNGRNVVLNFQERSGTSEFLIHYKGELMQISSYNTLFIINKCQLTCRIQLLNNP